MLIGARIRHYSMLHDTRLGLSEEKARTLMRQEGDWDALLKADALKPMSVLVGRNRTGKSSFLDGLSFLADCLRYDVPFAATLAGRKGFARLLTDGAEPIMQFSLLFHLSQFENKILKYDLDLNCDAHGRPRVYREQVSSLTFQEEKPQVLLQLSEGEGFVFDAQSGKTLAAVDDLKHPALAVFGLIRRYPELCVLYQQLSRWYFGRFHQPEHERSHQQSRGGHKHVSPTGDNLDNVLAYYAQEKPDFYRDMIERIGEKMPDSHPVDETFRAGAMTEGSQKLFTYLLLMADPKPRPLICLEEPDVGLYHDMVEVLGQEMRDYTLRHPDCQILFTTHNPFMLEAVKPDEVWVFRRQAGKRGEPQQWTRTHCAGGNPLIQSLYEQGVGMSAIWYGGHLDEDLEA